MSRAASGGKAATGSGLAPCPLGLPSIVRETMEQFAQATGRAYRPFNYFGDPGAERVAVVMGSATETLREAVAFLNARGEHTGVVQVRLYLPFGAADFLGVLPPPTRALAVLDRCEVPGASGDPLYLDVIAVLGEADPRLAEVVEPI